MARPAVVSHYNVQPVIDVYASTQGRDLGGVATDTMKVLKEFRQHLPRGTRIVVRGQVTTMKSSFFGLGVGLLMAILLVYFLIVVNFQSWLDPVHHYHRVAGGAGGHRLVSAADAYAAERAVADRRGDVHGRGHREFDFAGVLSRVTACEAGVPAVEAALEAGYTRIRPVLMTALAMIIGMVPMALGFGEGGEQNAPLGRAVIGGLLFATVATLFFVPSVFAMIHGRRQARQAAKQAVISGNGVIAEDGHS